MYFTTLQLLLITITFVLPSTTSFTFNANDDPTLSAMFNPLPQGWLGADVSASIELTSNKYLWLWGDTTYGNIAQNGNLQYRHVTAFPHSSIAFVNISTGSHLPSYWFRQLVNSTQLDSMGIFTPQNPTNPKEFYWTVTGIMTPTTQHLIVLTQVIIDVSSGFQQIGTDVVLVQNPLDSPEKWKYSTSRIASSTTDLSWNSGIAFNQGFFYIIGLFKSNAYLAKITEADLVKFNWTGMSYWSKGSTWNTTTTNMLSLYPSSYTEGTLQYHTYMQRWFVILAQAYESSIKIAYAEQITGPYTVQSIYNYPKQYQNGTFFSYAGKSHPEYAASNEIVFTYNVNCGSLQLLFNDLDIYHPKFVRVKISN